MIDLKSLKNNLKELSKHVELSMKKEPSTANACLEKNRSADHAFETFSPCYGKRDNSKDNQAKKGANKPRKATANNMDSSKPKAH